MRQRVLLDVPEMATGLESDAEAPPLRVRYRDVDGRVLDEEDAPPPPTIRLEQSLGEGRLGWFRQTLP